MKDPSADKKAYEKPQMSVMRINRFFFGACQMDFISCYSQYMFLPGAAKCQ